MFVQSHLQRNRLHQHQHHNQLPLQRHKSNKSLNTASNLTLSSVNSPSNSLKRNGRGAVGEVKQSGSGSQAPEGAAIVATSGNKRGPAEAFLGAGDCLRGRSLSSGKRHSLLRRDFSIDHGNDHDDHSPCGLSSWNQASPLKTGTFETGKRSQSLTVESALADGKPTRSGVHLTEKGSSCFEENRKLPWLRHFLGLIGENISFSSSKVLITPQNRDSSLYERYKTNLCLIRAFLGNFLSYQLETWRLLANDYATNANLLVCPDCQANRLEQPEANMYTLNPAINSLYNYQHEATGHNHLYQQRSNTCTSSQQGGHLHQHNHHQQALAGRFPPACYYPPAGSRRAELAHRNQLAREHPPPLTGSQHIRSLSRPNGAQFATGRHPLTSHRSLFGQDSAGDSSLKEDALSQFIIDISDPNYQPTEVALQQFRHFRQPQRRRQVLRQMSATNEPADVYPQAETFEPAAGSRRPPDYNEPFPVLLAARESSRHNSRQLMDKRYSNSWDNCQDNEPVSGIPMPPHRDRLASSGNRQPGQPPIRSGTLEGSWLEELNGAIEGPLPVGADSQNSRAKKTTTSDSEFYSKLRSAEKVTVELRQKSNEETKTPGGCQPKTLEAGSKFADKLRPGSQNSDCSSTSKKPPNGSSPGKLSLAGAKRRFGFRQKSGLNSLSVQRSEEIVPYEAARQLIRELTFNSLSDSGNESGSGNNTSHSMDPRACFVEGLGAGQIASRQALVSPYLGDIQLAISDRRDLLEVEVVRARQLQIKPGVKLLPSPYVKVYLMRHKKCIAKCKTSTITRTLNPLFQQPFVIREDYSGCILQVIVWADYGKKDRKSLMGIVQVNLNDLDISNMIIDWYRLFNAPSMASSIQSSKSLRHSVLPKQLH